MDKTGGDISIIVAYLILNFSIPNPFVKQTNKMQRMKVENQMARDLEIQNGVQEECVLS